MFVPFEVESVEELTLGANLQLSKLQRLNWTTVDSVNMASQRGNRETDTGRVIKPRAFKKCTFSKK